MFTKWLHSQKGQIMGNEFINVEIELTDEDRLKYSKELAEFINKKQLAEKQLKSFSSQKKAEIALAEEHISLYSEKINTGREYRDIECTVEYDWSKRVKKYISVSSEECMREDIISQADLQQHLDV